MNLNNSAQKKQEYVKKEKWLRFVVLGLGGLLVLFLFFVAVTYSIIYREVNRTCFRATSQYQEDCVDSLVLVLESEDVSIKQKNDAVWALGQIADKRSLPILKKLYTGNIPEREPLDKVISQYELKKSIHWIETGNWTSWMYVRYK